MRLINADKLEELVKIIDKPAWMIVREAETVDAIPMEEYVELKTRYKRLLETANILDTALRVYQKKYGDLEYDDE